MTNPFFLASSGGTRLADVLSFLPSLSGHKIVNRLYNGRWHVQTVGTANKKATVELLISVEVMDTINQAEVDGELLQIVYKDTTYLGYIESPIPWAPVVKGEHYTGTMSFLIEEVA